MTRVVPLFMFKDSSPKFQYIMRVLVFGGRTGWIGQKIVKIFLQDEMECAAAQSRLESINDVAKYFDKNSSLSLTCYSELDGFKPEAVVLAAGLVSNPQCCLLLVSISLL